MFRFPLLFALARLGHGFSFLTSPDPVASSNDRDQSWVESLDDSRIPDGASDPDFLKVSSAAEQSENQPLFDTESETLSPELTKASGDENGCGSSSLPGFGDDESFADTGGLEAQKRSFGPLEVMTDTVESSIADSQGSGGICRPRGSNNSPGTSSQEENSPKNGDTGESSPDAVSDNAKLSPPDCNQMPGMKRYAFCCATGPSRNTDDPEAITRRARCDLCKSIMMLKFEVIN